MCSRDVCVLLCLGLACWLSGTKGDVASDIQAVQNDFWSWRLRESPEFATAIGVNDYNDRVEVYGIGEFPDRKDYAQGLLQRLIGIKANPNFGQISITTKVNYQVLRDNIETFVNGFRWYTYTAVNPVNFIEGPQNSAFFAFLAPFKTVGDFNKFLTRMELTGNQIDEMISLMRLAIFSGHTNHNVSMLAVPGQIDGVISGGAAASPWYTGFADRVDNFTGSDMNTSLKSALKQKALHIVTDYLIPAYQRLKTFIVNEYFPHTRTVFGIDFWEGGGDLYAERLKWFLSVDMTPEQVHQKGLQEVERITKNMQTILDKHNFTGTIQQFIDGLANESTLHLNTEEEVVAEYKQIIFNRITPKLSQLFKDIPNKPVTIQVTRNNGPAGEYRAGNRDGSRPGVFLINLQEPDSRATYEMMSIALQETVPGQHMQLMYAQASSLPEYRKFPDYSKYYKVPFQFPVHIAYSEGWALYAEYLGQELGLYKDDFELMTRYKNEMFHACTMVVDTGIHAKGWTKERAIQYMVDHDVTVPRQFLAGQIDAYISGPGFACAYRIGELKIRELRADATRRLGSHFDIRDFHSVVLSTGPVPLSVLEEVVDDWVKEQLKLIPINPIG